VERQQAPVHLDQPQETSGYLAGHLRAEAAHQAALWAAAAAGGAVQFLAAIYLSLTRPPLPVAPVAPRERTAAPRLPK
jgi:hypothetical protein